MATVGFLVAVGPVVPEGWLTDAGEAFRIAKAADVPVVVNFEGSDWCPYCIKLRQEVFETSAFREWAKGRRVLLNLDFPRERPLSPELTAQNEGIAVEYGVTSYPTVLFLTGDGDVIGTSGYLREPGPEAWISHAEREMAGYRLVARREEGGWPLIVRGKELRAAVDLRGKRLPAGGLGTFIGNRPELRGKTLLIQFWATWCPTCVQMKPRLEAWQKAFREDLVVVALSDESEAKLADFVDSQRPGVAVATDGGRLAGELGVRSIPHTLLVSPDGVVRWQGLPVDPQDPLSTRILQQMVAASR